MQKYKHRRENKGHLSHDGEAVALIKTVSELKKNQSLIQTWTHVTTHTSNFCPLWMCIPGLSLYYLLFLSVCFSSSLKPPGKSLYHISGVWGCELRDLAFNIFHVVPFVFSVLPVSTAGVSTHGKQRDTEGRTLTLRCDVTYRTTGDVHCSWMFFSSWGSCQRCIFCLFRMLIFPVRLMLMDISDNKFGRRGWSIWKIRSFTEMPSLPLESPLPFLSKTMDVIKAAFILWLRALP